MTDKQKSDILNRHKDSEIAQIDKRGKIEFVQLKSSKNGSPLVGVLYIVTPTMVSAVNYIEAAGICKKIGTKPIIPYISKG